MSTRVRVVVIYEDEAQRFFLVELARRLGIKPIRFEHGRDCNGVLDMFATEVAVIRARNFQRNLGLLVCIDADHLGLKGRREELLRVVRACKDRERGAEERIALLVPTLEIENWYVHLCYPQARPMDEAQDYKESSQWRQLRADLPMAARKAIEAWQAAQQPEPPSIARAREELRRIAEPAR